MGGYPREASALDDNALNFRLMVAPAETPGRDHWQEVIPHDPAIKRDSVDAFYKAMEYWYRLMKNL